MNYAELQHIVQKLNFDLDRARVEQISDGDCRIQLGFKRYAEEDERRRFFVVIDFLPAHLDIYVTNRPRKAPAVPQAFTMLMRKYAGSAQVTGVRLAHDDRVVTFEFGHGGEVTHALIAELTGRTPRIFFVDAQTQIILGRIGADADRAVHQVYFRPESGAVTAGADRFADVAADDLYRAVEEVCAGRDKRDFFDRLRTEALRRAKKSRTKAARLAESLRRDAGKAARAEVERREADLLNAYAWQLRQGMKSAVLPDFETGEDVEIALDPALSIRECIEKRYAHSKRLLKAAPQIQSRLDDTELRVMALDEAMEKLNAVTDVVALQHLLPEIDELCAADERTARRAPNGKPVEQRASARVRELHSPFKTFLAADGTRILVGKTARDNIELTFRYTRGNDTWLHACGVTGSHVIVKSPAPTPETLLDAALLAMHYSKVAQAEAAEIQVTQVKFLKKIKGGPIGKVEVHGERAVYVHRDEARLRRLKATESN